MRTQRFKFSNVNWNRWNKTVTASLIKQIKDWIQGKNEARSQLIGFAKGISYTSSHSRSFKIIHFIKAFWTIKLNAFELPSEDIVIEVKKKSRVFSESRKFILMNTASWMFLQSKLYRWKEYFSRLNLSKQFTIIFCNKEEWLTLLRSMRRQATIFGAIWKRSQALIKHISRKLATSSS